MPPTVFPFSLRRKVGMLLGCCAFVAVGVVFLILHTSLKVDVVGVAAVVFFGYAALVTAERIRKREPALVVTVEGMVLAGTTPVAWSEIASIGPRDIRVRNTSRSMIEVVLRDPDAYMNRLTGTARINARTNRAAGYSPLNIPSLGEGGSLDAVLAAIRLHNPALFTAS